jgi:plastocyanin
VKKRFLIAGIVAIFGIAAFLLVHRLTSKTNNTTVTVQISAGGFSPSSIAVKSGTHIIWKNVDSAPHAVASNPYPSSASLTSLHSQSVPPNGSYEYTVAKTGVIAYHDDTQPTHNGSIKVEK